MQYSTKNKNLSLASAQAGLIYGPEVHYLDHLAPLCALMGIPLILTEDKMVKLAKTYYPDLNILHWDLHETPTRLVKEFNVVLYSTPRVLFDEIFYFAQAIHNKQVQTIWVPHGNSDKGNCAPFMEGLQNEELLCTYGPRMEKFLKRKGVYVKTHRVGNYRLAYYKKHKSFYDGLLHFKKPTFLYAPTWQDAENNSSFPDLWKYLLEVPKQYHLIIKLHPNLYQQFPNEISLLKEKVSGNIQVLEDFPPIYPLLQQIDLYIGDMSSIGYDFLSYHRPMLFLSPSDLAKAGRILSKKEYKNLFFECRKSLEEGPLKNSLYEETFSEYSEVYAYSSNKLRTFNSY